VRIVDLLERNARIYGPKRAVVVHGGQSLSYRELRDRAARCAGGLERLGVRRGDRVAVVAHNGLTFFDVYLACAYLGAAAVPVSTRLAGPEVQYQLGDAEPSVAVVEPDFVGKVAGSAPAGCTLLVTDSPEFQAALTGPEPSDLIGRARPDDLALIIYTSGTTGKPKGACLTHKSLTANAVSLALGQRIVSEDVFMSITPLYHAATGVRVVANLLDGQTHVVMPEFTVEGALDAIEQHQVTTFIAVPTQLRRLLDSPTIATRDLSSLRLICYGAAPTVPTLIRRALATIDTGFYQGYGLSESTSAVCGLLPSDHLDADRLDERLTSCGRPLPGIDVRLCREDGTECVVDEIGEICVRGDNVMAGYWRNDAATKTALRDGWLHTGDLARRDADGYLYISGRAKDMLISGGVNVYPIEIESVLCAHPVVAEAAVVGAADPEWGEVPVAFLLLRAGAQLDADDLEKFCSERLARLKVPQRYEVVDEFPRTDSGKVRKGELRTDALGNNTRQT
jgi:O-succinylbenzoate-CoA ligase